MRVTTVRTKTDIVDVKTYNADFIQKDLSNAVNTKNRNEVIVRSWLQFARKFILLS